jgi:L-rhamnose-H+ transport protein
MSANPFHGLIFHWIGGLASASFYIPYRGVRKWAWETYWLVGGFFSWLIAPWILALLMTRDLPAVFSEADASTLFWTYFFGVLWGLGGLTFGLTMRYLGISLGMAVALGFCAVFGTLLPPIFQGEFVAKVLGTHSGLVILLGVGVCVAGIVISGAAGMTKEKEMSDEQKRAVIKEFLRLGGGRTDQGANASTWDGLALAGTSRAGHCLAGRIYDQFYLVPFTQYS